MTVPSQHLSARTKQESARDDRLQKMGSLLALVESSEILVGLVYIVWYTFWYEQAG